MNCRRFENDIALHAAGDLIAKSAKRLTRHLETCAPCRNLLAQYCGQGETLHAMGNEQVSDPERALLHQSIMARIEGESPSHQIFPARWKAASAFLALLFVGIVWGLNGRNTDDEKVAVENFRTSTMAAAHVESNPPQAREAIADRPVAPPAAGKTDAMEVVIKLVTDNPDVVIILVGGAKETNHVEPIV